MKTIYKYPLVLIDDQLVAIRKGAEILCVQVQSGIPCLWASVGLDAPIEGRKIMIHGTGQPLDPDATKYIGTFQMNGGLFMFHVFEKAQP